MTIFVPLERTEPCPPHPAFLNSSDEPQTRLAEVLKAVRRARRVTVVSGAGISVQAGIPDFRSSEGLFRTLKKENPKEALSSGKDLFTASVFSSEQTTTLFCQMIAKLSEMSEAAEPTPFHRLLRTLDDRGRLLRVYTQNIDALESKCGLSFGVPDVPLGRARSRAKSKPNTSTLTAAHSDEPVSLSLASEPDRLLTPPVETPRCIPLHGTLQSMRCQNCMHTFPLSDHLTTLSAGVLAECPECLALEETRHLIGKRSRGVGRLRPAVVLYDEVHRDGESVGEAVRKDLMGGSRGRAAPDLLLVVGTSLRVPGTKRIVREFAKAVKARDANANTKETQAQADGYVSRLPTPSPSPRRTPAVAAGAGAGAGEDAPLRTIYLNLDFPVPTREWEGVFDVWVKGDAQTFARMLQEEIEADDKLRESRAQQRRKNELAKGAGALTSTSAAAGVKRRVNANANPNALAHVQAPPKKKRKTTPLTPPSSPRPHPTHRPRQQMSVELPARSPSSSRSSPLPPTLPKYPSLVPPDPYTRTGIKWTISWRNRGLVPEVVITTTPPCVFHPHHRDYDHDYHHSPRRKTVGGLTTCKPAPFVVTHSDASSREDSPLTSSDSDSEGSEAERADDEDRWGILSELSDLPDDIREPSDELALVEPPGS